MASASATQRTCYAHSDREPSSTCAFCGRDICQECETIDGGVLRCPVCAATSRRKRYVRNTIVGVVVAGALVALYLLTKRTESPIAADAAALKARYSAHEKALAAAQGSTYELDLRRLRQALAQQPCDLGTALELSKTLNRAGNYQGTLEMAATFTTRCGRNLRLLWAVGHAHEKRKEWDKAVAVDTVLIKSDPRDADFWWWRARNQGRLGHDPQAFADFLQSIANQTKARPYELTFLRLGKIAQRARLACDGASALNLLADAAGKLSRRAGDLRTALLVAGDGCEKLAGRGEARIELDPKGGLTRVRVRVGSHSATFAVDPGAGLTLVSAHLARRLGLASPAQPQPAVSAYALAKVRRGPPVVLPSLQIHKARADQVQAAVVDGLPPRVDGVVGLSFLWRFSVARPPGKIEIKAR